MPRLKSVVIQIDVDEVQRAHNCQGNARHRLSKGDLRLKVRNKRSWDHYCATCGVAIVDSSVEKLRAVRTRLAGGDRE